jgi:hypothetical protein
MHISYSSKCLQVWIYRKFINKVEKQFTRGMCLGHRTCYYADQLSPRERRTEVLVSKMLSGMLAAANSPEKH